MDFLQKNKEHVEQLLDQRLPPADQDPTHLHTAMRYAVLNGGKRIRASLCYAVGKLAEEPPHSFLDQLAMAVELFHAYSLVHDDLPAMDNDDLRRGSPSCHVAYGESTAILVGDALQSLAFEILCFPNPEVTPLIQLKIASHLAKAIGSQGMAGGQSLDLLAEGQTLSTEELAHIHHLKTGAFLKACITTASWVTVTSKKEERLLADFGHKVGLAFQIMDDVLEVTGQTPDLGKPSDSDLRNQKATYPKLMGLQAAHQEALSLYDQALHSLIELGHQSLYLQEIAKFILFRAPLSSLH